MKRSLFNFILFLLIGVIASYVLPDLVHRGLHFNQSVRATSTPALSLSVNPIRTTEVNPIATTSLSKSESPTLSASRAPQIKTQIDAPIVAVIAKTVTEKPVPVVPSAEPGALVVSRPPEMGVASSSIVEQVTPLASGALHQQGILSIVNIERAKQGLQPLAFNKTLAVMAEVKSLDMITKQYFAHVAPDGTDVAKLAERYSYEYLRIGENLAMGDFVSNKDVMEGWMNSPGHRANILNSEYTEIGISAVQGMHDGRLMWYAVQEFGRPSALCPSPDALLAKKIVLYEAQLASLEKTMSSLRAEIATANGDQAIYNAKAKDYNTIVDLYNSLVSMTKEAVKTYNAGVEEYNRCIK